MTIPIHRLLASCLASIALAAGHLPARAAYPERPVQLVIPFPAGGAVDVVARRFADVLGGELKQPVVVMNRDGASGVIAMEGLANATPDGYSLGFAPNGTITVQPALRKLRYDLASFRPICQVSVITYVLVVPPDSPDRNLGAFVARAKAGGDMKMAIGGVGTLPHFAVLQLAKAGGTKFLTVPYRGDPGVAVALRGGDVQGGILAVDSALAQGFRILAVFSPQRLGLAPDAPTAREQGFDVLSASTAGLFAPAKLTPDAAQRLQAACESVTGNTGFRQALNQLKQEPAFLNGERFNAALDADAKQMRQLVEESGIRQEQ